MIAAGQKSVSSQAFKAWSIATTAAQSTASTTNEAGAKKERQCSKCRRLLSECSKSPYVET